MVNVFILAFLWTAQGVLLEHRIGLSYGHNMYGLVGGKLEAGETALQGICREVFEETGLVVPESHFNFVHAVHRKGTENEIILLCFAADISNLQPLNKEPDKHDEMRFFSLENLPENMIPAHRQIIECMQKGIYYSQHGWD